MKKIFTLFILMSLAGHSMIAQGVRYVDEVFANVAKIENQIYSINVTVVTGTPAADTLRYDLYLPVGDTCTSRPLAVILHTGTFLPRGFVSPTGDKNDYANVQVCEKLAKRGYVAASIQYRKGWNPIAPTDIVRRSTIINAAYRSIQDLYAFLRFVNLSVTDLGNPFFIDTSRVAIFGVGTGGFVAFNAAVLSQEEIYIDKFRDPVSGVPFVDTLLVGDVHGVKAGLINVPNHVGYNDKFHFVFGLDGAVGDSSWMEDGNSVPLVAAGTITHPTTPYGIDPITGEINCELPVFAGAGTGSFVVNIGGSACMIEKANSLGINDPLNTISYNDPVSAEIRTHPLTFNQEHLWAIDLPGPQTGPWEYWDSTFWKTRPHPLLAPLSIHDVAIATNPDMSLDKANRYIDTAIWFFSPRAYAALKLSELVCSCEGVVPDPYLITDFECQRNFNFGAGADKLSIIPNPYVVTENASEKVGLYLDPADDPWAALCVNFGGSIDLSAYNQFQFQVNSTTTGPILVKLEGGTSPGSEKWLNVAGSGEWETITADFSSQAAADHTRVCLFPNGGVAQTTVDVYLFDNLRWELGTGIFNPTVETLMISPNPVQNALYVRNSVDATRFRIVNTLGQQVLEQSSLGQSIVTLNVGDLQPGVYMIAAFDKAGNIMASGRVLKQ